MKLKTRAAHKELDHESTRLAACLCAAVDAARQAESYGAKKYPGPATTGSPFAGMSFPRFSSDNICSLALSLYIRRREESKPPQQWNRREKTPAAGEAKVKIDEISVA